MMTQLTGVRQDVFLDRYSLKDKNGRPIEKYPEEMWRRVALAIAKIEKTVKKQKEWEDKFYQALFDFKFVPGGRILTGAGSPHEVTFYNCFVLPNPKDSRKGILETLEIMTEIMAKGGGVGFNISALRPRGSYITTVNGTSSGPVNWAEIYSVMTHDVIQQGGSRRGALMLMMWDWHPDIEEFITVKKDHARMVGANLSVCISNDFMQKVKEGGNWQLLFPDTSHPKYNEIWDGDLEKWKKAKLPVRVYKTVKARFLWDLICESTWTSAEPGAVFMDRYNEMNNTWYFEKVISVNVCGEQGLPAWGVCNLGALNLSSFIEDKEFNYTALAENTKVAVRFLDNVIDAEHYLFPEMEKTQRRERRTGLGTMGLGDALIKMRVRYGSEASLPIIERIYQTIRDAAYEESVELAKEKGPFPKFDREKYLQGKFVFSLPKSIRKEITKHGIRNAVLLTQAPTGKISLLSGVTSGIEPVFAFSYKQKDRLGERIVYHELFKDWREKHRDEKVPDYFVTASELTPEEHVQVQALIQKYTDSSISKTVNAPNNHTVNDVKKLYSLAYELGCKGITYMREGSREGMLERVTGEKEVKVMLRGKIVSEVRPRPVKLEGATYRMETPVGVAYITINQNGGGEPMELFLTIGKAGSDIAGFAEAIGRLVSLILRMASPLDTLERARNIVAELRGIGGSKSIGFGEKRIRSLPDAIAKAISTHFGFKNGNGESNTKQEETGNSLTSREDFDICPKCGVTAFAYEEGCMKCYSCGYSEC
jgi:ribonucleoside-diphosphate reductase alpha chain